MSGSLFERLESRREKKNELPEGVELYDPYL